MTIETGDGPNMAGVNPAADPTWVAQRDQAGRMNVAEADAYYAALVVDVLESTDHFDAWDVARAVLGALAGAERLRTDDSGAEVQLRARYVEVRGWRRSQARIERLDELNELARRLGIDLRPMPDSMG